MDSLTQRSCTIGRAWPMLSCTCRSIWCQLVTWIWPPPNKQCGYRKSIKTLFRKKIQNWPNSFTIGQRFASFSCKCCWGQEGVINIPPLFCYLHTTARSTVIALGVKVAEGGWISITPSWLQQCFQLGEAKRCSIIKEFDEFFFRHCLCQLPVLTHFAWKWPAPGY